MLQPYTKLYGRLAVVMYCVTDMVLLIFIGINFYGLNENHSLKDICKFVKKHITNAICY